MTKNFDNDIKTFFYNEKKKIFLTMTKTNFFDNDKKGPATKKGFLIQSGGDCK